MFYIFAYLNIIFDNQVTKCLDSKPKPTLKSQFLTVTVYNERFFAVPFDLGRLTGYRFVQDRAEDLEAAGFSELLYEAAFVGISAADLLKAALPKHSIAEALLYRLVAVQYLKRFYVSNKKHLRKIVENRPQAKCVVFRVRPRAVHHKENRQHLGNKHKGIYLILRPEAVAAALVKANEALVFAVVVNGALQHGFYPLPRQNIALNVAKLVDIVTIEYPVIVHIIKIIPAEIISFIY